jgi:ABC-type glycerol-3-phosphate transport system substrate-binding protein
MYTRFRLLLISLVLAVAVVAALWRSGVARAWGGASAGRPIQLKVWDWWSPSANEEYGEYFAAVERVYEERYPQVDVVLQIVPFGNYVQKLATAMVGSAPPDLFQSSVYWAEGFYQRGMLLSLDSLLAQAAADTGGMRLAQEVFLPSAWRHNHTADGTVFGIPQIIDAQCLIWNLDLLQAAAQEDEEIRALFESLPEGRPDYQRLRFEAVRDWEHFRRLTKKLTRYNADGSVAQAGFAINAYSGGAGMFPPWLAANGGHFQDEEGTRALFATPGGVEALEFMATLYWEDKVCPPFRRQIADAELFEEGKVVCIAAGTWSGKDIIRDTLGWKHFAKTAFPPGPRGSGQKTLTWGNMLVISRRCPNVEAAWNYLRLVCGLEGNLLRLKYLGYNGPRLDLYQTPQWQKAAAARPYLANVPQICLAGDKLRHTEIIATDHQANPVFETLLLRYPEIAAGQGPYPSVAAALEGAARNVDQVYSRYHQQAASWLARRGEEGR